MKNLMFDSFRQWRICIVGALEKFLWGAIRLVLYTVTGVASILRWLWRLVVRFVGLYPTVAIIAAVAICVAVWVVTFARGRASLVKAEHQRDSLAYRVHQLMQIYDEGEEVIIGQDTITYFGSYDQP